MFKLFQKMSATGLVVLDRTCTAPSNMVVLPVVVTSKFNFDIFTCAGQEVAPINLSQFA